MLIVDIKSLITKEGLTYGSTWSEEKLMELFSIDAPDISSRNANKIKDEINKFTMAKLSAYGSINKQLLSQGMCFVQEKDIYRVPLISEMQVFISKYYNASQNKFNSAEKLRKSFSNLHPVEAKEVNDKMNKTVSARSSQDKAYQPMA